MQFFPDPNEEFFLPKPAPELAETVRVVALGYGAFDVPESDAREVSRLKLLGFQQLLPRPFIDPSVLSHVLFPI